MRKLNFKDMFAVAEIIRKAKIRSELAALISGISAEKAAKTDKTAENAGKAAQERCIRAAHGCAARPRRALSEKQKEEVK